jgi:hypothetical protein
MALQFDASSQPPNGAWKKRLVWTLVIVAALIFSLWAISATVDMTIWGAYNHFIDTLCERLAINHYLANALSLVFLVPFFVGVKYYLFSIRNRARKQRVGLALLLSMGLLYNLALYFGTKNQNFGPEGSVRYYALVPGGVVFSDRPGAESQYGVAFRPVTTENIKWLLRIERGRIEYVIDPGSRDWFDRVTGDPMLWYSTEGNGNFRFFDGPGHDPASRAELKPVTPDTRKEWEKKTIAAATVIPPATAPFSDPSPQTLQGAQPPESVATPQLSPSQSAAPRSGVLHYEGSPVPHNGTVVFDHLPQARLKFTFDHQVWSMTIKANPDGTKRVTMTSQASDYQTSCDLGWEVVE